MKKIIALIPARGGSKGVKDKNIREVGTFPLIAYSIAVALLSKWIGKVTISTNSLKIGRIAKGYGGEFSFLRPEKAASDTATDIEWVEHALEWLKKNENYVPDLIIHLRPTTPLRDVKSLNLAITKFLQCPEATSMRSVHVQEESPYKMFIKDDDYLKPFMIHGTGEFYNLPRQAFPHVYAPNGYIDILRPSIIKKGSLHGNKILSFETPKVIEVDSEYNLLELDRYYKDNPTYKFLLSKRQSANI